MHLGLNSLYFLSDSSLITMQRLSVVMLSVLKVYFVQG